MPRPIRLVATLLLILLPLVPLAAQWQWSLMAGSASATGHARADGDPDRPEIAPDHPATLTLGLTRLHATWRVGAMLGRTESDLAVRGIETAVVTRGTLRAWGVGMEVGRRVAGPVGAPALAMLAGASLDRWTFQGTSTEARYIASAQVAVEGQIPLRPRWRAIIRGELAVGGSLFRTGDLPLGYATRMGRRAGIRLGVGWSP